MPAGVKKSLKVLFAYENWAINVSWTFYSPYPLYNINRGVYRIVFIRARSSFEEVRAGGCRNIFFIGKFAPEGLKKSTSLFDLNRKPLYILSKYSGSSPYAPHESNFIRGRNILS